MVYFSATAFMTSTEKGKDL